MHSSSSSTLPPNPHEVIVRSAERLNELCDSVYFNDLLMENILQNVVCDESKRALKRSSWRIYELSKRCNWVTELKLHATYDGGRTNLVHIQAGVISASSKCCIERIHPTLIAEQNEHMMSILNQIIGTYGRSIERVEIDGDQMLLTKEILEVFDRCAALKSISISKCSIGDDALDHVKSSNCQFKNRVTSLSLMYLWIHDEREEDLADLVGNRMEKITIKQHNSQIILDKVIKRFENTDFKLKMFSLELNRTASTEEMEEMKQIVRFFQERSEELTFSFHEVADRDPYNVLCLAEWITRFKNIKTLHFCLSTAVLENKAPLKGMLENFKNLENLENLLMHDWKSSILSPDLINAVAKLKKLKKIHWVNHTRCPDVGDVKLLMSKLPKTVDSLILSGIPITKKIIDVLVRRCGESLKLLIVKNPKKFDPSGSFKAMLRGFKNLKVFEFDAPVPVADVNEIINHNKIDKATVLLENAPPLVYDLVLQDNFWSVSKKEKFGCYEVHFADRKLTKGVRLPNDPKFMKRIHTTH